MAAPGLLGLVLGLGLFGAPAGAVKPKPSPLPAVTCSDNWKAAVSGKWMTASNWSTGVVPTSSDNVCIKIAGTYKVTIAGAASVNTLSLGGKSGTQNLTVKGTPATASSLSLAAATGSKIGTHGVLTLKSKNVAGSGYAMLEGAGTTVANSGTFQTSGGQDSPDYLRVSVSDGSTGKTKINGITAEDGSGGATTLTNKGSFSVGTAGSLVLTGGSSFTQSGGTFTNNGVLDQDGATFTQTAGADSGNPVSILDANLVDAAESGTYTFDLFGSDNLSGTIPSGQTVDVIGNPSYSSSANLAANLTNDGTLLLDSQTTAGSGFAILNGATETVTNAGTFETEGGTISTNYLRTNITNNSGASVEINGHTTDDGSGGATTLTNNGTFSVGSSGSLVLTGASSFTQNSGTFTNNGVLDQEGGTFTQTAGTDSGNPVSIINANLVDAAESGTFTFDLFSADNLSGTIPSGQTVDLIGNPSYGSSITLGANLTNDGTLIVDSQTTAGSSFAELYGPTETVTNAGTFEVEGGTVSPNYLRTNVTNNSGASVDINGLTTDDGSGGATTLTNHGTFSVGSSGSLVLTGASSFTQSSGTFTNSGVFDQNGGTFTQTAGTDSGNPVSVFDASLVDAGESGTYAFDLTGSDTLSGTIPSGQTVDLIGNPTYNSTVTLGANLTNDGTLIVDSETTAGSGYTQLYGPTETVINAGTFEVEGGTVNKNYLRTNVTNNSGASVDVNGLATEDGSGGATTLTNNGTLSVGDGDGITLSGGSGVTQASTGTFAPTVDVSANTAYGITGGSDNVAGTLHVTTVGTPTVGSTFNVINSATLVTGTFSSVVGSYTVTYSTTAVTVKAT